MSCAFCNRETTDVPFSLGAPEAPSAAHAEPETLQIVPYAQAPHVVRAVRRHGDNAAFHLPNRHVLTHHCALCNQWMTVPGKMKQHYTLSHAATHGEFATPAAKLCSRFNTSGSPCEHCGAVTKAPRQHPSKCTGCISGIMEDIQECFRNPVLKHFSASC